MRFQTMRQPVSIFLIVCGVLAIVAGLALRTRAFAWFGNLPGDIRYSSGNIRIYFPIASMLIVSVALSFVLWVIRRWL